LLSDLTQMGNKQINVVVKTAIMGCIFFISQTFAP
jgi:hypothetical protein